MAYAYAVSCKTHRKHDADYDQACLPMLYAEELCNCRQCRQCARCKPCTHTSLHMFIRTRLTSVNDDNRKIVDVLCAVRSRNGHNKGFIEHKRQLNCARDKGARLQEFVCSHRRAELLEDLVAVSSTAQVPHMHVSRTGEEYNECYKNAYCNEQFSRLHFPREISSCKHEV